MPLGAYGNGRARTPWIDRLAAGGVRFDRAHAHNVVTLPSHANILSGRYPFEHGVRDNAGFRFPQGADTLATRLRALGYRTGAFVSAFPLDSRFGLDRGFDVYDDAFADGRAAADFVLPERSAVDTVAAARRFLDARDGRPSFCWLHVYDPHAPYRPPASFAAQFPGEPVPRGGGGDRRRARRRAAPAARRRPRRPHAGGADERPRRVAGRARRADARAVRVRGHAARAARAVRAAPAPSRRRLRARPPRGHRADRAGRAGPAPCRPTCPAAACCARRPASASRPRPPTSRR